MTVTLAEDLERNSVFCRIGLRSVCLYLIAFSDGEPVSTLGSSPRAGSPENALIRGEFCNRNFAIGDIAVDPADRETFARLVEADAFDDPV